MCVRDDVARVTERQNSRRQEKKARSTKGERAHSPVFFQRVATEIHDALFPAAAAGGFSCPPK